MRELDNNMVAKSPRSNFDKINVCVYIVHFNIGWVNHIKPWKKMLPLGYGNIDILDLEYKLSKISIQNVWNLFKMLSVINVTCQVQKIVYF